MMPESAFVEYLPYEEVYTGREKTCLPSELKKGEMYEIVLTNFCGFYRYRLGDVVGIVDFFHESPVVEFMFRTGMILDIAGEKLSVGQLEKAVRELEKKGQWNITEYCVGSLKGEMPGRYAAVFAAEMEKDVLEQWECKAAVMLDLALKRWNADYCDLREMAYIEQPEVLLLNCDEYRNFINEIGFDGGHNKPHHMAALEFSKEIWGKWKKKR
jgi:hypothetical protein